ncbi:hypothetical protein GCM10022251_74780 [Phytohabitans flavus]|uniref:Uncharacterized protein n=1 Tax=Phytohabitans flavus TaxID=1076124 RepID=A0A6F8XLG4_9ACTN|nr:hypothetical protein Pflav_010740 [Phytohabitans flavus]
MVTRRNPDPAFQGALAAGQALDLSAAIQQTWFAGRLVHEHAAGSSNVSRHKGPAAIRQRAAWRTCPRDGPVPKPGSIVADWSPAAT